MDSIEEEDEVVVDIQPPQPKRKKIATMKVNPNPHITNPDITNPDITNRK